MKMSKALKRYGGKCPHCGRQVKSKHELWYCDKCKRGGNTYRYLADHERIGYLEAYYRYGDGEFDD